MIITMHRLAGMINKNKIKSVIITSARLDNTCND